MKENYTKKTGSHSNPCFPNHQPTLDGVIFFSFSLKPNPISENPLITSIICKSVKWTDWKSTLRNNFILFVFFYPANMLSTWMELKFSKMFITRTWMRAVYYLFRILFKQSANIEVTISCCKQNKTLASPSTPGPIPSRIHCKNGYPKCRESFVASLLHLMKRHQSSLCTYVVLVRPGKIIIQKRY